MLTADFVFGVLGLLGGLLCAAGDMLFDLKGPGNIKYGPGKMMDSNWQKMAEWRFKASILFASVGVPLYLLGLLGMSRQLARSSAATGTVFLVFAVVGACGGFFIHAMVCCFPIISKTLAKMGCGENVADALLVKIFNAVKVPFLATFCCLVGGTSVTLIYAILAGHLRVPIIFVVLNPLGLMLLGWLFRLVNRRIFADLPGIIMPSVGIAMVGLMAAVSA